MPSFTIKTMKGSGFRKNEQGWYNARLQCKHRIKVNKSLCLIKHHAMQTFLTSAVDGSKFHAAAALHSRKEPPSAHWVKRAAGPRAGAVAKGKIFLPSPCPESNAGHPAHSVVTTDLLTELPPCYLNTKYRNKLCRQSQWRCSINRVILCATRTLRSRVRIQIWV
jgi:hypothetical protein